MKRRPSTTNRIQAKKAPRQKSNIKEPGQAPSESAAAKQRDKAKTSKKPTTNHAPPAATDEPFDDKKRRAKRIVTALRKLYPDAECALKHASPFQLLIATILSAQSTDGTVNKVTPILFESYPTPRALADAPREEVERIIHSTGFFRQKARSIQEASRKIADDFGGQVPQSIEQLTTLPGVARKTANVVLGTAFGLNEGVVVDTHIGRLACRLGLTWTAKNGKDALKIERDIMQVLPKKDWTSTGHALIWHGRRVCSARKPNCSGCSLADLCPSAFQCA
jgi:endonuclease III